MKGIKAIIRRLSIILLSTIGGLIACVIYLIIINLGLFHKFHEVNVAWHVSSLEVYWPFALIIGIVCIAYIYGSRFHMNADYIKNQDMQQKYDEAELDFLKHKAIVNVPLSKGHQCMTVAELEQSVNETVLMEHESNDNSKKNYVKKIIDIFGDIYQNQKKTPKRVILLELVGLIVVVGIAVTRACIPTIYRKYNPRYTYPNTTKPSQVELINVCYYIISLPLYFIYLLMILYGYYLYYNYYNKLNVVLQAPINKTRYGVVQKGDNKYFLDLRRQQSLELFFAQLRQITKLKDTIEYQ
ncbi:unnamed protein product, partial [Rotaria sp. Silwood2]